MKKLLFIFGIALLTQQSAAQANIDYFGQTPPGDTPVVFARGIVSTDYLEHSAPAFSPDGNEVFWWINRPAKVQGGEWLSPIMMTMRRIGDVWTAPTVAPYFGVPVFSADSKRLYFDSSQPMSGIKTNGPCFVEKMDTGWSGPKCIDLLTRFPELQFARGFSITRNGTFYFSAYLAGPMNNSGIYRSEFINGEYTKPEPLPSSINMVGGILNWTPFIAPDESYLLFSSNRRSPSTDGGDMYVCFRQHDGSWTNPVSLGEPVNSGRQERFPAVSPDGEYLFFTRWTPDYNQDIFWVSADIIKRLREKNNLKK